MFSACEQASKEGMRICDQALAATPKTPRESSFSATFKYFEKVQNFWEKKPKKSFRIGALAVFSLNTGSVEVSGSIPLGSTKLCWWNNSLKACLTAGFFVRTI